MRRDKIGRLFELVFGPTSVTWQRCVVRSYLVLLFLAGGLSWLFFFREHSGEPFFRALDWKVAHQYYQVIQEAYQTRQVPWHVSVPLQPIQPTRQFLSIPESLYVLAPQAPWLAVLTLKQFVVANVLLHYMVGFAGCLALRRRFSLSPLVFTLLFLLFNYNGHILAHVAAGHPWDGYFYLPFLAAFVFDAAGGRAPVFETAAKLTVVNLFILLQGSLHLYVISGMTLALVALCSPPARRTMLLALVLTLLVSMFRLLPAAFLHRHLTPEDFLPGYVSFLDFWLALTHTKLLSGLRFPWEYHLYLSTAGVAFLFLFGILLGFSRRPELVEVRYRGVTLALLALSVLAFRDYWFQWIYQFPALVHMADKLPNTERVPPRFLVVPLVFLIAMACARLQKLHRFFTQIRWLGVGAALALFALAVQLRVNWSQWRLNTVECVEAYAENPAPWPHLVALGDPNYRRVVIASLLFSLAALAATLVAWAWLRARRRARMPELGTLILPETTPPPVLPAERRRFVRQVLVLAGVSAVVVLIHTVHHWFSPPGLRVTYYRDQELRRAAGWDVAKALFRDFREDPPPWWLPRGGFSSRWTARLDVPRTGPYIFYSQSCDGLRLYLDGRLVIDNWRDQAWLASGKAAEVPLTAGRHTLVLEHYARDSQSAALRVRWCGGDIPPNTLLAEPYLFKSR